MSLDKAVRREFPAYFQSQDPAMDKLVAEGFYPIGWSRDGKFAYVHEPVDEECGCYFADLVIQDMVSDKVVWEFKYDQQALEDPKTHKMPPIDDLRKLWRKHRTLFARKLRQHGIRPGSSMLLAPTRLAAGGHVYDALAHVVKTSDQEHDDQRVNEFRLDLASPGQGVKALYWVQPGDKDYLYVLDAAVLGVIKSPYEQRLAVVAMEVNRGWEGPPHSGYVRLVGGSLKF